MLTIDSYLDDSLAALTAFRADGVQRRVLADMADALVLAFQAGRKLLLCGNGGSAGDAQHIAGEVLGRLMYDRPALPALALTTDSSVMTAVSNDYGYDRVFERQVMGLGQPGDVLMALSTSGTSANIMRALEAGKARGLVCLGMTGEHGGTMRQACALLLEAPSTLTPIIQQIHITAAHLVCALVEQRLFPR